MAQPFIWNDLPRTNNDNTTIDQAIGAAILSHNDDPDAHYGPDRALEVHRENPVVDHPAESVVNDKIRRTARRFVAIVDPASEEDFNTVADAIEFAKQNGGGDIYITRGTHYISSDLVIYPNIGLYGDGVDESILESNSSTARTLQFPEDYNGRRWGILLTDAEPGGNTFTWEEQWTGYAAPKIGLVLELGGATGNFCQITAYDATTQTVTIDATFSEPAAQEDAYVWDSVITADESDIFTVISLDDAYESAWYSGASIVIGGWYTPFTILEYLGNGQFRMDKPDNGGPTAGGLIISWRQSSTVNISGLSFGRTSNRVKLAGDVSPAVLRVDDCSDVYLAEGPDFVSRNVYINCYFQLAADEYFQVYDRSTFIACNFIAVVSGALGVNLWAAAKFFGCRFYSLNSYTCSFITGYPNDWVIDGCDFTNMKKASIFTFDAISNQRGGTFTNNTVTLSGSGQLIFKLAGTRMTNNRFIVGANNEVLFESTSKDCYFAGNYCNYNFGAFPNGVLYHDNMMPGSGRVLTYGLDFSNADFTKGGVYRTTVAANVTLSATVPPSGTRGVIIITTSGTTTRTVTFGGGFRSAGTLATGTVSGRIFMIEFISNGTVMYETSRTGAIVA